MKVASFRLFRQREGKLIVVLIDMRLRAVRRSVAKGYPFERERNAKVEASLAPHLHQKESNT